MSAVRIGRIARESRALVRVSENGVCMSSCVFILAGGVSRIIEGSVGIHAPFFPNEQDDSYSKTQDNFLFLEEEIKAYLSEMNVSDDLYEDMLRVPASEVKMLNQEELIEYGLYGEDPFYREAAEIREAKKLGITREQLILRKRLKKEKCDPMAIAGDMLGYVRCADKIMGYEKQ